MSSKNISFARVGYWQQLLATVNNNRQKSRNTPQLIYAYVNTVYIAKAVKAYIEFIYIYTEYIYKYIEYI